MKPTYRIVKYAGPLAALVLVLFATALNSFKTHYADLWQQLGITEKDGTERIRESFLLGYLQYYGAKNLKNIATADRKAVSTDLLNYAKKYVQSPDFKKAYEEKRLRMKPREVTKKPKTAEEIRKKLIDDAKKGIAGTEKTLQTAEGDMKKTFAKLHENYKKQLEEYQQPDNKQVAMMAEGEKQQFEAALQRYAGQVKKWELDYPADASAFIKNRLQQVLAITADIDYGAELVERNNKRYFLKPDYEKKPLAWKAGFRAGKEVTETVRIFVEQWIKEL